MVSSKRKAKEWEKKSCEKNIGWFKNEERQVVGSDSIEWLKMNEERRLETESIKTKEVVKELENVSHEISRDEWWEMKR